MSEQFNKYYNVRIKLRNDSWANWKSKENDFCPYDGEIIIYDILKEADAAALEMTPVPYQLIKIGDGETRLKDLPFINEMSSAINITTGSKNGTISVMGEDIYVAGLSNKDIMCFQNKNDYFLASEVTNQHNILSGRIDTNAYNLQQEIITRTDLIYDLQAQINSISGNNDGISLSSLQNDLNTEKANRIQGQSDLEEAVNQISISYTEKDSELTKSISDLQDLLNESIQNEMETRKQQDEAHTIAIQEHNTSIENIEKRITEIEEDYIVSLIPNENKTQYTFSQKEQTIGTVDVPLECYVTDGRIERNGKQAELQLNIKNIINPVLIDASLLIDTYTHETNASQIQVNVDENTKIISASFVPGSITSEYVAKNTITKDNLSGDIQKILTAAELTLGDSIGSIDTKFDELVEYIDSKTSETGVIAGTYGQLQNFFLTSGSEFTIPQFTVDSYGKLSRALNITCKMPEIPTIIFNGSERTDEVNFYAPTSPGKMDDMLISMDGLPIWISANDYISSFFIWDKIIDKPVASNNVLGLIKIGYSENDKNYALKLDANNQAYITVPWEGVLSISTGTVNGTISVNTNGIIANVAVKGLGSAAYTNSNAYDAAGAAAAVKNELLNGAGAAYDTLKELGDLINVNHDAIDALNTVAAGKADREHTHSYAGSPSIGGPADSANKLNTNAGSTTQPVYFNNGIPVATTYALNKTVPANAVFTDTTYSANNGVGLSGTTFYNTGVRAISTGGSNGTITVNTNGTNAEVAVKGLGSNAYNSTAYLPLSGGTMTGIITTSYVSGTWINSANGKSAINLSGTSYTGWISGNSKNGRLVISSYPSNSDILYFGYMSNGTISAGTNSLDRQMTWDGSTGTLTATSVYGAVYNDYAEYRSSEEVVSGNCIYDDYDGIMKKTSQRLQPACKIVSDTFGFAIGQTDKCKTPTAVCGRVLAIPYEERETYAIGDCVCSGPGGTVSKMTREEIIEYPDRIVGVVSEIPEYKTWGENNVEVNGRIWIYVR